MIPRWPRRSARKASAPSAGGPSPAALSDPSPTPPAAGSSPSVRIIASGSPAVPPSARPGAPEERQDEDAWPFWIAWPHAADAIHAEEMTAAQLRAILADRDTP